LKEENTSPTDRNGLIYFFTFCNLIFTESPRKRIPAIEAKKARKMEESGYESNEGATVEGYFFCYKIYFNVLDSTKQRRAEFAAALAQKLENLTFDDMSRRMWLLVRPFFCQTFRMCKDCNDFNYKRDLDRFRVVDGRMHIDTAICKTCVWANIESNNIVYSNVCTTKTF
jgi:hypothetical protein